MLKTAKNRFCIWLLLTISYIPVVTMMICYILDITQPGTLTCPHSAIEITIMDLTHTIITLSVLLHYTIAIDIVDCLSSLQHVEGVMLATQWIRSLTKHHPNV